MRYDICGFFFEGTAEGGRGKFGAIFAFPFSPFRFGWGGKKGRSQEERKDAVISPFFPFCSGTGETKGEGEERNDALI